ncbi:hypothetical protein RN001_005682 [Aquatica leii]|uniref:Uncharacterized protein n=1 Tax=Aquatica leii TaxID=1421715 RepID=A0AAN7QKH5_9COLE|nr:hypothetical protein RN001_005682 [Aquatica leii]
MEINLFLTAIGVLLMVASSECKPSINHRRFDNPMGSNNMYMNVAEQPTSNTDFQLPHGFETEKLYLVTKKNLGNILQEEDSFLHGKNPNEHPVPVYAIVTPCTPNLSFHSTNPNTISDAINAINNNIETPPHFHVVYWIFYPYNEGKEICLIGKVPTPILFGSCLGHRKTLGNHVGDWEHISLSFTGNNYPNNLYVSVHDSGAYYKYDPGSRLFKYEKQVTKKGILQRPKFPIVARTRNNHPILFSAKGSHGLWAAPGDHYYVKVPRLIDKNGYGIGWETWKNLVVFHVGISSLPSWLKKLGLCEISDGPRGNFKANTEIQRSETIVKLVEDTTFEISVNKDHDMPSCSTKETEEVLNKPRQQSQMQIDLADLKTYRHNIKTVTPEQSIFSMHSLPLKREKELLNMEEILSDEIFFQKCIDELSTSGENNIYEFLRRVMVKLFFMYQSRLHPSHGTTRDAVK